MIITAVDPDLSGGIATVDFHMKQIVALARVPARERHTGKGRELDAYGMHEILSDHFNIGPLSTKRRFVVEAALTRPQTVKGGFANTKGIDTAHQTFGAIRALGEALWRPDRVTVAWPSAWKRDMGLSSDKDLSLALALEKWPSHEKIWAVKKNTGIAEAILLAEWHYMRVT